MNKIIFIFFVITLCSCSKQDPQNQTHIDECSTKSTCSPIENPVNAETPSLDPNSNEVKLTEADSYSHNFYNKIWVRQVRDAKLKNSKDIYVINIENNNVKYCVLKVIEKKSSEFYFQPQVNLETINQKNNQYVPDDLSIFSYYDSSKSEKYFYYFISGKRLYASKINPDNVDFVKLKDLSTLSFLNQEAFHEGLKADKSFFDEFTKLGSQFQNRKEILQNCNFKKKD